MLSTVYTIGVVAENCGDPLASCYVGNARAGGNRKKAWPFACSSFVRLFSVAPPRGDDDAVNVYGDVKRGDGGWCVLGTLLAEYAEDSRQKYGQSHPYKPTGE